MVGRRRVATGWTGTLNLSGPVNMEKFSVIDPGEKKMEIVVGDRKAV